MKYFLLPLFIVLFLASCSEENSEKFSENSEKLLDNAKFISADLMKPKIGDTITISGSNLNSIDSLFFRHTKEEYKKYDVKIYSWNFIARDNEHITLQVPTLVHEDITVRDNLHANIKLSLSGIFCVAAPAYLAGAGYSAMYVQLMSESVAFKNGGYQLFKSTDGFYNWTQVFESPDWNINSFYFLNLNQCWIGVLDKINNSHSIYYSENGGKDFSLKFKVTDKYNGSFILKIQFVTDTKGFFIDNDSNLYITDNNSFKNIFDHYPELSVLTDGKIDIYDFNVVNENLLFISPNDRRYLIKIENGEVSKYPFEVWPSEAPKFHNNTGFLQVNSDIYKSTDLGNSWVKVKTFENHYPRIHFFNENEGLAFVNYTPEIVYKTTDGGVNWKQYMTIPKNYGLFRKHFYNKTGLLRAGNRGRLFKFKEDSNFSN